MKVILPGSYDPITLGHLEIIKRAAEKYDEVLVVAFVNPEKKYHFSEGERLAMLKLATADIKNVTVDFSSGRVVDYMSEHKVDKIVKGYRNDSDLDYEKVQAEYNLKNGGYETEFIPSESDFSSISSTAAREAIERGLPLDELLPQSVAQFIKIH